MPLYVVNSEPDSVTGHRVPVVSGISWVGNLYSKNNGNVFKFLLFTPSIITGLPGVFGPIDVLDLQASIDADGGTIAGWTIDEVPSWAVGGVRP